MFIRRTPGIVASICAVIVGAILTLGSSVVPWHAELATELFRVGFTIGMLGCTTWVLQQICVGEALLEQARQDAYDRGYSEGCDVRRLTLMRSADDVAAVAPLAGRGAAQELGEQVRVGDAGEKTG